MNAEEIKKIKKSKKDELDEIFVDKNEPIDKKLIVEILKPFVTIDEKGLIEFKNTHKSLITRKKILLYLICRKATFLRQIISEELVGPKEISIGAGISEGSAKNISRDEVLSKITKKENGKYFIPNYKLVKVKEILFENDKNS